MAQNVCHQTKEMCLNVQFQCQAEWLTQLFGIFQSDVKIIEGLDNFEATFVEITSKFTAPNVASFINYFIHTNDPKGET